MKLEQPPAHSGSIYAGWLIDGGGNPVRKHVIIHIQNGWIKAIRAADSTHKAGPGELDLSGHTVLPCLVDSHVHLFMSGTPDSKVRERQLEAPFRETIAMIARHITDYLRYGVTTVRDGGDHYAHALRYKKEFLDTSQTPFQLQAAGRAWHRQGRYGRLIGRVPDGDGSLAEAIAAENAPVDHIKIVNSGLNSLMKFGYQTPPQFTHEDLQAAVKAARRKGLSVMVHANGKIPVEIAVSAGCRSIEHGFFMGRENLKKMADKGTFWIPTAATMKAYWDHWKRQGKNSDVARRNLEHQMEQIAAAKDLGVSIAVGTDAGSIGVDHGRGIIQELAILKESGFSIQEAIRCAAANGARLLNLPGPYLLAQGSPASFIVVAGSPDELPGSLASIRKMCIQGKYYPVRFE